MSTATEKKRAGFEGVSAKGYPAPKELATPTDLKPQEVQRIVLSLAPGRLALSRLPPAFG